LSILSEVWPLNFLRWLIYLDWFCRLVAMMYAIDFGGLILLLHTHMTLFPLMLETISAGSSTRKWQKHHSYPLTWSIIAAPNKIEKQSLCKFVGFYFSTFLGVAVSESNILQWPSWKRTERAWTARSLIHSDTWTARSCGHGHPLRWDSSNINVYI
jgi:hypothetical protein